MFSGVHPSVHVYMHETASVLISAHLKSLLLYMNVQLA